MPWGIFNCYNHNGRRQAFKRLRLRKLVNTILYFRQPCNPVTQSGLTQDAINVQSELALSPSQGMEVVEVKNDEVKRKGQAHVHKLFPF